MPATYAFETGASDLCNILYLNQLAIQLKETQPVETQVLATVSLDLADKLFHADVCHIGGSEVVVCETQLGFGTVVV